MNNPAYYWYVAVTYRKERIIKQELDKMNIKNFVPLRNVVKERNGKKVKLTELVIPGYVFIYTDPKTSRILTQKLAFSMRYLKAPKTYNPVTIPEKQMQDFIFLLTFPEEQTNLVPCNLARRQSLHHQRQFCRHRRGAHPHQRPQTRGRAPGRSRCGGNHLHSRLVPGARGTGA